MRILIAFLLMISGFTVSSQSLISPSDFFGYPLGSYYTEHFQVMNYYQAMAKAAPQKMVLQSYGKTNEGKPLTLAFVSAPENIQNLEEIRKNNLRLTGLLQDKSSNPSLPTVIWLSYNVHGNETSSTEASMKVLYELISSKSADIENYLKHTIVIIDPCLNPDGRDRYVHWFNQMLGKKAQASLLAREHDEPWPTGRYNHYFYDLNRDWAWQTQVESQQRIKVYNTWMPSIHCDFHEQSINAPYYFAPAAEPFHEVITPFQRNFQQAIGKNHAKYFDQNGWLYFTKEIFDLFYPSYGDTYPVYNGSIGMTYEQAGNSRGGLTVQTNEDTLTLLDRINHHYTTSISTIEIAAKNATTINQELKKYFDDLNSNGSGNFKSFVINGSNTNKLKGLIDLLKKNDIQFGYAKQGQLVKGFHYFNNKEESISANSNDLIVSTCQSKGALVRVLFEPLSKLKDSVTYDITAWSLPYAYGLDCYGVKEKLPMETPAEKSSLQIPASEINNPSFAYLIEYASFNDGKLLAALLSMGVKVRVAESDFSLDGRKYKKGTLVVMRKGNENKMATVLPMFADFDAHVNKVNTGFMDTGFDFGSDKVRLLKKPTVAVLSGEGTSETSVGDVWHLFDQQLNYNLLLINAAEISNKKLAALDVLIIPDGQYKILSDKESNIKNWVREGGKLIVLESAIQQMTAGDWGIKLKKEPEPTEGKPDAYADIKRYENRERESVSYNSPGAIYKVELDDSHPLAFGYDNNYYSLKMNNAVYEFLKDGWNVGIIKKSGLVSGYVGSNVKENIKDGTVIAAQEFGRGSIVYFADNLLFRSFWENGKLMFTNAVFLVN